MVTGPPRRVHNPRVPARMFYAVVLLLSIAAAPRALQPAAPEPGITGRVLAHDGAPVTSGTVTLALPMTGQVDAPIDRQGRFRILPDGVGERRLFISVPGHAPYRAEVDVPRSRSMALPDITLVEATYFRARFATENGEPLAASGLWRRALDSDGLSIGDPLGHVREQAETDGTITIGPLPGGRTLMAFNRPGLAQTRLRDLNVTGNQRVIDGGTITIRKGAELHVDVVDAQNQPVKRHEVWLEDANQPSPLSFQPVRTNDDGRAIFERLAPGRYRVSTQTVERCGPQKLSVSRLVTMGGTGSSRARLVIDGRVAIRVTSPAGPLFGRAVSVAPDGPPELPWQPRLGELLARARTNAGVNTQASCVGVTDHDGRLVLAPFPPGPAVVRVSLFNSALFAKVTVPEASGEIAIQVPDGFIPVRVTDRSTEQPVAARITWAAGGGRIEAATTPNGDALIEGAGNTGGTMTIAARGYQTLEGSFAETPDTQQEIALAPAPSERLTVRVVADSDDAIGGAVVQLLPRGAGDAARFTAADAKGIAAFLQVPEGPLQFSATQEGFKPAAIRVAEDQRASITITLSRLPAP